MSLKFCSFASGSTGNCYLIANQETGLLLDPGITGRKIFENLEKCGLRPEGIGGIFVTHEHIDHVKSLRMVSRMTGAPVYGTRGTLGALSDRILTDKVVLPAEKGAVTLGSIKVETFALSHDSAEPCGYSFSEETPAGSRRITVLTDSGIITEEQMSFLKKSDLIVLEANHERNVLLMGKYPYHLKLRILGEKGHISNEDAAFNLARMLKEREDGKVPTIALAHLSSENNTPDMAYVTVKNILFDEDLYEKKHYHMTVVTRDEMSPMFEI